MTWYQDIKTTGLKVGVGTRGKTFYLYRKIKGRPERIKIGAFPDLTVEQARKKATEMNALIAQGINPADQKRSSKAEMTFAEFFQEYLEKHAKIHKKTWDEDEATYNRYFTGLAKRKLSAISKADIRKLHHDIGANNGPYAANRALAILRVMYNLAKEWGYYPSENPAASITPFKEKSRDRYLQSDEIPRFWQALLDEPNQMLADFFMICLLTGARRSNVQAMRWDEISFERAEWRIPETKNGESLVIPLIPEVIALLDERRQASQSDWVFPGKGKTGHLAEPKSAWKRVCDRAGLKNLRIHDLRRTLGSTMAAAGVNTITTARTMGQKTLTMALRYQQLGTDPKRQALEAGGNIILTQAGVK